MNVPCYGKLYSSTAKECQICIHSMKCWEMTGDSAKRTVIKSGYTIAIMKIISERTSATVGDIKEGLERRFPGKDLNIYYYLNELKKRGLLDMKIDGRQRYYSIR